MKILLDNVVKLYYIWEKDLKESSEQICEQLNVVLNRNVKDNNRAKSVELLRDNTEVTNNSN